MSDLEKDKAFKAPTDANALSKVFDNFNGDFDTPQEFVSACIRRDPRALEILDRKQLDNLRDALENMAPEIRQHMEFLIREKEQPKPEFKPTPKKATPPAPSPYPDRDPDAPPRE